MISNCDQPIVIVKDNGKSIHEPKIAIAFEARKSPNNIVMVWEVAGEFDEGEVVVRHIHLQ